MPITPLPKASAPSPGPAGGPRPCDSGGGPLQFGRVPPRQAQGPGSRLPRGIAKIWQKYNKCIYIYINIYIYVYICIYTYIYIYAASRPASRPAGRPAGRSGGRAGGRSSGRAVGRAAPPKPQDGLDGPRCLRVAVPCWPGWPRMSAGGPSQTSWGAPQGNRQAIYYPYRALIDTLLLIVIIFPLIIGV